MKGDDMRELKFRAWDKEKQRMLSDEWIQTLDLKMDGSWIVYLGGGLRQYLREKQEDNKIVDCDLMQYTGLKDKNGKEIYEGDIVRVSMSFEGGVLPHQGEIVYSNTFGAFATKNLTGETLLHNHCLHTMEVIGNIYEQPELLK